MPKPTNRRRNATTQKGRKESTSRNGRVTKKSQLADLPDEYLECRSYNVHLMKRTSIFYWRDHTGSGICRISVCQLCGTIREDYYNGRRELVYRNYERPEGYDLTGTGKVKHSDVLDVLFSRLDIAEDRDSLPAQPLRLV